MTPINTATDGSQIWKITHDGVDTHPIHFHLYDVQFLYRVGWDGVIRKPDLTEIDWKDAVALLLRAVGQRCRDLIMRQLGAVPRGWAVRSAVVFWEGASLPFFCACIMYKES